MSRALSAVAISVVLLAAACGPLANNDDIAATDTTSQSSVTTTTTQATGSTDATVDTEEATPALSVTTAPTSALAAEASITTETTSVTAATGTTATTASEATSSTDQSAGAVVDGSPETVRIRFESQVADVPVETLIAESLAILNDPRGWVQAGFTFVADEDGPYRVVLAEGPEVDALCLPLMTYSKVSCQNGPVVALNADRWRTAVDHWVLGVEVYRGYLVNHEVGHLIGQRHPKPRCPVAGRPAGVMEQQTAGLEGCIGNPWPRDWELTYARARPVVYAPLPDWGPDPVPANTES